MHLTVTLEYRFQQTPDGAIWSDGVFSHAFWQRYLEVFDAVRVMARVRQVSQPAGEAQRADGAGISFVPLPHYIGPAQYLRRACQIERTVANALTGWDGAVILRIPSHIASITLRHLPAERPFGVQVVGDPYEVFAPGVVEHPLRRFFRWQSARSLRRQCGRAAAASYVTKQALQQRYPPGPNTFSVSYSDVYLTHEAFVPESRTYWAIPDPIHLVLVGSLAQMYKAPDVLIDSVATCVQRGLNLRLTIVGDGKFRPALELRAFERSLADRVAFTGNLPSGQAVRDQLDSAALFVLPSRTEGLPRAMIEAMARGLPCLGSTVAGIPELLPPEDMVPPDDVEALAQKIAEIVNNPTRMLAMSARNLRKAHEYSDAIMRERRLEFYRYVRARTEEWLQRGRR